MDGRAFSPASQTVCSPCWGYYYLKLYAPSNSYIEFQTPSTLECNLCGNRVTADVLSFLDVIKVTVIQDNWCPHKKGKFGHRYTLGEHHMKVKTKMGVASTSQEMPEMAPKPPEAQESMEQTLPHSLRRNQPCWHLGLGLLPFRTERMHFCCSSPAAYSTLTAALADKYRAKACKTGRESSGEFHGKKKPRK